MRVHSNQLKEISHYLQTQQSFQICDDIKHCNYTCRHARIDTQEDEENKSDEHSFDPIMNLYIVTLDSIHVYIFHLHHIGHRIDCDTQQKQPSNDKMFRCFFCKNERFDKMHSK